MAIRRRAYAIRVLVYMWLMITFMFFSRTHFTRAIYWYTTIMYTHTRRRNARPVNINHVTRSRTIIRPAAALLHILWRRRLWSAARKIIFFFPGPHLIGGKRKNVFVRSPATTAVRLLLYLSRHGCVISVYTPTLTNLWSYVIFPFIRTVYAVFYTQIFRRVYIIIILLTAHGV